MNIDEGLDIKVSLTTSKFIIASEMPVPEEQKVIEENIPVCITELNLGDVGFPIQGEQAELVAAKILLEMIQKVYVDTDKKIFKIGVDLANPDSMAIDFQEKGNKPPSVEFFKRWSEVHRLLLEFQVFHKSCEPAFTIKGFYENGKWTTKTIEYKGNITVI